MISKYIHAIQFKTTSSRQCDNYMIYELKTAKYTINSIRKYKYINGIICCSVFDVTYQWIHLLFSLKLLFWFADCSYVTSTVLWLFLASSFRGLVALYMPSVFLNCLPFCLFESYWRNWAFGEWTHQPLIRYTRRWEEDLCRLLFVWLT